MSRTLERPTGAQQGVGASASRVDGNPKVRGAFEYASDLWRDDQLWGATHRSPHARARILSIDAGGANRLAGVHAVVTAADLPGKTTYGIEFADQPVLAGTEVSYIGQPIAIVAAETPEIAAEAARRIEVRYEVLPAVVDMEEALQADAPSLRPWGNVVRHVRIAHGDPDADADIWVEGYYETGRQDQAPLGPEAGLAIPGDDGGVDLYVATQWIHHDRRQIAPCLDLPLEQVRMHMTGIGGAFGAREDIHMQIHACLLALRTGRAVKMSFGREESFVGHVHRHPARIWMRHGIDRHGHLQVVRVRLIMDGGAFASTTPAVIGNASAFSTGPYVSPNALIDGTAVYTNNPPCGAMRGFGAPQVCFAYEAQMDKLAHALGIDPVELRLMNAYSQGSSLPTGQEILGTAPVREVIERCRQLPGVGALQPEGHRSTISLPGGAGNVGAGRLRRGVGFAVGFKNVAYAEGFDDYHQARVTLRLEDGKVVCDVESAGVECGEGLSTILVQVARTELDIEDVRLLPVGTALESAGSTSASRQSVMGAGAVQGACREVARDVIARAAEGGGSLDRFELVAGTVRDAQGSRVCDLGDVLQEPVTATYTHHHRRTTPLGTDGQGDAYVMFAFGAMRATVEVDVDLGLVRVLQLAGVQDVGRALNPQGVEGQIEGGGTQGMGLALMEELQVEGGLIRNPSFTDYLLPTTLDAPSFVSDFVEEPEPGAPYGAKGAGEGPAIVASAAIAAALRDAVDRPLNRIPVRPDDLVGLSGPAVPSDPWPAVPNVPSPDPLEVVYGDGHA